MNRPSSARTAARPLVVLALVLALFSAVGAAAGCTTARRHPATSAGATTGTSGAGAPSTGQKPVGLARSQPVRIEVPSIAVRASVVPVGLTPQGTVEVPPLSRPETTGWYVNGPTPGEIGPAVILGHVDSTTGPAVFFRLSQVRAGDPVLVARADGTTARFLVVAVEAVAKTAFPTERVYGDLDHPALRLVTCGGTFDQAKGSYQDNIIAYADLDTT